MSVNRIRTQGSGLQVEFLIEPGLSFYRHHKIISCSEKKTINEFLYIIKNNPYVTYEEESEVIDSDKMNRLKEACLSTKSTILWNGEVEQIDRLRSDIHEMMKSSLSRSNKRSITLLSLVNEKSCGERDPFLLERLALEKLLSMGITHVNLVLVANYTFTKLSENKGSLCVPYQDCVKKELAHLDRQEVVIINDSLYNLKSCFSQDFLNIQVFKNVSSFMEQIESVDIVFSTLDEPNTSQIQTLRKEMVSQTGGLFVHFRFDKERVNVQVASNTPIEAGDGSSIQKSPLMKKKKKMDTDTLSENISRISLSDSPFSHDPSSMTRLLFPVYPGEHIKHLVFGVK
jgi:hypothetical protein